MVNCCPKPRFPRSVPAAKVGWVWMAFTPGCSVARSVQLRPFRGSSRTVVALTTALMSEVVALAVNSKAQDHAPLKLVATIPLPGLHDGDFDHFAPDVAGHRLFITGQRMK